MPHARIEVLVPPRAVESGRAGPDDRRAAVGSARTARTRSRSRLQPHPGAPAQPLQRGASGGELSRVMLAIEVVFAGVGGPPTLVFDEVDAGVGGQAAVEIGRRLARLARGHQVVVVTHLPQVAAFADHHLVVAKDTAGAVTTSGVQVVRDTERARELARMLAGLPDSDLGIAHAEELLAVADREKGAVGPARGAVDRSRGVTLAAVSRVHVATAHSALACQDGSRCVFQRCAVPGRPSRVSSLASCGWTGVPSVWSVGFALVRSR